MTIHTYLAYSITTSIHQMCRFLSSVSFILYVNYFKHYQFATIAGKKSLFIFPLLWLCWFCSYSIRFSDCVPWLFQVNNYIWEWMFENQSRMRENERKKTFKYTHNNKQRKQSLIAWTQSTPVSSLPINYILYTLIEYKTHTHSLTHTPCQRPIWIAFIFGK